jgi:hypothetical protein
VIDAALKRLLQTKNRSFCSQELINTKLRSER